MPNSRDIELRNYPPSSSGVNTSNGTTEVTILAAPGAGKRLRLRSLHLSETAGAAAQTIILRNGISGATFYKVILAPTVAAPTFASRDIDFFDGGFTLAANSALMAAVTASTTMVIGADAVIEVVTTL